MTTLLKKPVSQIEYLTMDRESEVRLEFDCGRVLKVEDSSYQHGLITSNLVYRIGVQFDGRKGAAIANTLRVTAAPPRYSYPDVVIIDGEPQLEDAFNDTLLNPKVIIEVLSATSESSDRGRKWELYRGIPSLAQFVLIDQRRPEVEVYERQSEAQWSYFFLQNLAQSLPLPSIQCSLPLSEIYEHIVFEPLTPEDDD